MKIISLKAHGFIGFKNGMGLDDIDVNFDGLDGLVALAGPNGHGKSTMLENLSPFRTLASRSGALKHHVFLRDSFRDLEFELMGDRYRTLLKIDSDSDRSEGFIWKNGEPQVNGKVTEYGQYLFKLMGSAKLFYSSVFCAQGSQRLSDMTTGELKALFTEFLRLDRLAGYEKNSKQCLGVLESLLSQSERRAAGISERLERLQGLNDSIDSLKRQETEIVVGLDDSRRAIMSSEVKLYELTQAGTRNDDLKKELAGINDNIKMVENSISSEKAAGGAKSAEFDQLISDGFKKIQACNSIIIQREQIETAVTRMADIDAEISERMAQRDSIAEDKQLASDEYLTVSKALNELQIQVSDLQNSPKIRDLERQGRELSREAQDKGRLLEQLRRDQTMLLSTPGIMSVEAEIKACKNQMMLLDKRDPACQSKTCSFILAGLDAQNRLPGLEETLASLKASAGTKSDAMGREISALNSELTDLDKGIKENAAQVTIEQEALSNALHALNESMAKKRNILHEISGNGKVMKIDLEDIDVRLKKLKEERMVAEQQAKRLPELEVAMARRDELMRQEQAIDAEKKACIDTHNKNILRMSETLSQFVEQAKVVRGKMVPNIDALIDAEKQAMTGLNSVVKDAEAWLSNVRREISKCQAKIEEKDESERDLEAVRAEITAYKKDISDWTYLRNACGKNGLQALEIDGVAPMITGYANDLLAKSFGPNFTVKLVTQDPETGKEVLDIVVIREDGAETLLENLSGGEKVWILKALRLAMTLVSKEKSGRDFQTFFADEEDGALDGEKALNFIGLYRSLMSTGDFNTCFYISHNPEVVAMADHQIRFSREGIEVA